MSAMHVSGLRGTCGRIKSLLGPQTAKGPLQVRPGGGEERGQVFRHWRRSDNARPGGGKVIGVDVGGVP